MALHPFVRLERKELAMSDEKERTEIYVNEDRHEINTKKINYERVVDLYLGEGGKPSPEYLIKYSHGPSENPKGRLARNSGVAPDVCWERCLNPTVMAG